MRTIVDTLIFLAAVSASLGMIGYCIVDPDWIAAVIGAGAAWAAWRTHPWRSL